MFLILRRQVDRVKISYEQAQRTSRGINAESDTPVNGADASQTELPGQLGSSASCQPTAGLPDVNQRIETRHSEEYGEHVLHRLLELLGGLSCPSSNFHVSLVGHRRDNPAR